MSNPVYGVSKGQVLLDLCSWSNMLHDSLQKALHPSSVGGSQNCGVRHVIAAGISFFSFTISFFFFCLLPTHTYLQLENPLLLIRFDDHPG